MMSTTRLSNNCGFKSMLPQSTLINKTWQNNLIKLLRCFKGTKFDIVTNLKDMSFSLNFYLYVMILPLDEI